MFLKSEFSIVLAVLLSIAGAVTCRAQQTDRESMLLDRISKLEERLAAIESRLSPAAVEPAPSASSPVKEEIPPPGWLNGTTINGHFDGYYLWNTNRPLGRVNLLRAYDATANNFSLNQAGLILEKAPNLDSGRRWGYRLEDRKSVV